MATNTGYFATLKAIKELNNGGGTRCKNMDELKCKLGQRENKK